MIHANFINIRSFEDFAAAPFPWSVSRNDRVRFWNVMISLRSAEARAIGITSTLLSAENLNVSRSSLGGSVSKLTKMLRHIVRNRRARFSSSIADLNTYRISCYTEFLNPVFEVWLVGEMQPATFRGRGPSSVNTRAQNRPRVVPPVATAQVQYTFEPAPAMGTAPVEAECNCVECRSMRQEAEERSRRTSADRNMVALLNVGFNPFLGLDASVLTTLMLESVRA